MQLSALFDRLLEDEEVNKPILLSTVSDESKRNMVLHKRRAHIRKQLMVRRQAPTLYRIYEVADYNNRRRLS
ncbi:hypothetical protein [Dulcicalothrix desertica]|uniref:hypothetical protein n=1 Tax=Dulcicalothrix desertica TaxID=32056 RepID=UPI000F8E8859|nr:hypothetical protein [Dulcicalothrix desertica]TWH62742.1 hypothetical protein CAL7102_00259 [Dulcicalothrix desertica PCC 7102]